MTASEKCKKSGLKSLTELVIFSGFTAKTLRRYYAKEPSKFNALLLGCVLNKTINKVRGE